MELNFDTAPVPQLRSGRTREPNPFDDIYPTPEGEARTLTLKGTPDANEETIRTLTNKARRAASALNPPMTSRVQVTTEGTGKNATTILAFWTVEKISRPARDQE